MNPPRLIICALFVALFLPLQQSAPITFEEFPANTRLTDQYREARGVTFNDLTVTDFPQGFAHSGTKAAERCFAVEFNCDRRLIMSFPLKPQRRVKLWFGYDERLSQSDEVILTLFNAAGASVGEARAALGPSAGGPVPVANALEATSQSNDVVSAIVSLRSNAVNFAGLVFDDLEFDDALPPADLAIESVQAEVGPDRKLFITAQVKNIGQGPSSATTLQLTEPKFWETPPATDVPALNPNQTAELHIETALDTKLQPRAYSYRLIIDPQGLVPDADRSNNAKGDRFLVSRGNADLSVKVLQAGAGSDQAFVIAEVTNIGTTASAATIARVELDGREFGKAEVQPLPPQGSTEVRIVVAEKLPPGQHPFEVLVDPEHRLPDSDLSNNRATGSLTVPDVWWWWPDILFVAGGVLVVIVLTFTTYKLVKRKRRKRRQSQSGGHDTVQPTPKIPTFAARPHVDHGTQTFSLASPQSPGFALQLRPHLGAGSTQISDGINPSKEGQP